MVGLRKPADFETVRSGTGQLRDAVFVVEQSQFFIQNADTMVGLEQKSRTPAMYATRSFVDRGGTVCYGVSTADLFRRSGGYVDRILRGARPADLPVEQPTKFDFVVNAKTAKAIGLKLPPSLLMRVDQVIE